MYGASEDAKLALIRAHPDLGEKVGVLTEHSRLRAGRRSASTGSRPTSTSAS